MDKGELDSEREGGIEVNMESKTVMEKVSDYNNGGTERRERLQGWKGRDSRREIGEKGGYRNEGERGRALHKGERKWKVG